MFLTHFCLSKIRTKITLVHPTFRVMRQSCSAYSLNSKYPCEYACPVCRYRSCHLHQLRHFALPGLLYPIRHNPFGIVLIDLHPDFPLSGSMPATGVCSYPARCQAVSYTPCRRYPPHYSITGIAYLSTPCVC